MNVQIHHFVTQTLFAKTLLTGSIVPAMMAMREMVLVALVSKLKKYELLVLIFQPTTNSWCLFGCCVPKIIFADIDECEMVQGICGFNAKCHNTMGNFTCSCLSGYEGTAGVNCTDIDECMLVSACHSNAICLNAAPFFTCSCEPGYSGNGFNCAGKHLPIYNTYSN